MKHRDGAAARMSSARDDEFTEYVTARLPWLGRVAYLLCQDRHRAEDLVQTAITRLYVHWRRAAAADNLDGYAHTILVRVYLSERSSAWARRVRVSPVLPDDTARAADVDAELDLRAALGHAGATPAGGRRTALLLRPVSRPDRSRSRLLGRDGEEPDRTRPGHAPPAGRVTSGDSSGRKKPIMSDINMLRERLDQIGNEAGHLQVDVDRARARGTPDPAPAAGRGRGRVGRDDRCRRGRGGGRGPGGAAGSSSRGRAASVRGCAARSSSWCGRPRSAGCPPGWPQTASWRTARTGLTSRPTREPRSGTGPVIILTDYGRGPQPALPDLPGGVPATMIPAADVNGHRAYWITAPTTAPNAQLNFELRWQYAPDKWADLQAAGLPATSVAGLTQVAYKIAATATLGGHSVVSLPIGVAGIPPGLRVRRAVVDTGAGRRCADFLRRPETWHRRTASSSRSARPAWSSTIRLMGPGHRRRRGTGQGSAPASLFGPGAHGVATNTVIDGHPAYDSQLDGKSGAAILWVFGVHGFDVQIDAGASALAAMPRSHDLIWLFSHMTVGAGSHRAAAQ